MAGVRPDTHEGLVLSDVRGAFAEHLGQRDAGRLPGPLSGLGLRVEGRGCGGDEDMNRDRGAVGVVAPQAVAMGVMKCSVDCQLGRVPAFMTCLLSTSDAAD